MHSFFMGTAFLGFVTCRTTLAAGGLSADSDKSHLFIELRLKHRVHKHKVEFFKMKMLKKYRQKTNGTPFQ